MKKLTVELTADETETILDVLEASDENEELYNRLAHLFSAWLNEKDDKGEYVNR